MNRREFFKVCGVAVAGLLGVRLPVAEGRSPLRIPSLEPSVRYDKVPDFSDSGEEWAWYSLRFVRRWC